MIFYRESKKKGDDVAALLLVHLGHALDRQVARLGAAGGEDDVGRLAADQLRDLLSGTVDALLGCPSVGVGA